MENKMALDTLPDLVLENILKYFSYDEIAKFRSISTKFNLICKSMLTKGFKAVEKYHLKCLKVYFNPQKLLSKKNGDIILG